MARLARSKRTSPLMFCFNSCSSSAACGKVSMGLAWELSGRGGSVGIGSLADARSERLKRRRNAARLVRDAGQAETHFHAAQCSRQHQIVEAAEMPDAKHFTRQPGEAGSERHVKVFQDNAPQPIRIMAFRHKNSGERAE